VELTSSAVSPNGVVLSVRDQMLSSLTIARFKGVEEPGLVGISSGGPPIRPRGGMCPPPGKRLAKMSQD